jgi:DNA repair protein RecO (recombination protein O)
MLHKTQGVVFRFTKYGESSIIVNIFTDMFGLQSYIVNGVRSRTTKSRIALYQPLTLLDLVVYHRENANINRIKEIKCLYPYQSIHLDNKKSGVALFLNEVINKTIKEESHAEEICGFMIKSFVTLDQMESQVENFHLRFLLKLSRHLGFGAYKTNEILGPRIIDASTEQLLADLIDSDYPDVMTISNSQRRELLDILLRFYSDHVPLGEVRSVQVLRDVIG